MKKYIGLIALTGALLSAANAQFVLEPINIGPIDPSRYTPYQPEFFPAAGRRVRVNLQNIPSWDRQGDTDNFRAVINVAPDDLLNGVYWDVTLEAISPSWLSEMALLIVNVNGEGYVLRPGAGQNRAGTGTFSGGLKVRDANLPDTQLPDNRIYLEFFETFDDASNAIDGFWRSGFVEFQVVPEPASVLALGAGLAGLVGLRRRSKK